MLSSRGLRSQGASREWATFWCRPRFCTTSPHGVVALLTAHHKAQPLSEGMPREEVRERLFRNAAAPVFDDVVATLAGAGRIVARERLALAGHQLSLTPEEERAREAIERMFLDAGLAPPDASALHGTAGLAPAVVERVTKLLVRQKTLVRVDTLLFHTDALSRLRSEVKALKVSEGSEARVDVAAFKLRYGSPGSTRFRCWSISIASA